MSNNFFVKQSIRTPQIEGDIEHGTLKISGKSLPENTRDFYAPFYEWLLEFFKTPSQDVTVDLDIEYYNTSTSNFLIDMLKKIKGMSESRTVKINWHFEKDDYEMEEIGEDFQSLIGNIVELKPREPRELEDPFKPTEFR